MIGTDLALLVDDDHPKEECGVIGIYSPGEQASNYAFFALQALQHRGQESAGLASADGSLVVTRKTMGLVSSLKDLHDLDGELAIGHTRYSTTGKSEVSNAGPIEGESLRGSIAVAHNGNLVNATKLRQELMDEGVQLVTSTDSEAIAQLIVRNLGLGPEHAVGYTMKHIEGGYAVAVITKDMIIAFRDPHGIRPMVVGTVGNKGYMVASESCAFTPVGGKVLQELHPGEMVIIDKHGMRFAQGLPPRRPALCLFETIYFARPDSIMADTTLYKARQRMGEELAVEWPAPNADMVIPVPDSGVPAALGFARKSGLPFEEGMMKNRYIHRTFIQPEQKLRERAVLMKLSPMEDVIRGKSLVVVDDSIVRATTTQKIVALLKAYGAKEVHVRITAPPIKWPCYYGIDMSDRDELVAANFSIEEIRQKVGAESLGYLSLEGCVKAVGRPVGEFCTACFTGQYPVKVPSALSKSMFDTPDVGALATVGTQS